MKSGSSKKFFFQWVPIKCSLRFLIFFLLFIFSPSLFCSSPLSLSASSFFLEARTFGSFHHPVIFLLCYRFKLYLKALNVEYFSISFFLLLFHLNPFLSSFYSNHHFFLSIQFLPHFFESSLK